MKRDGPDLDILYCIKDLKMQNRGTIKAEWVKGHQEGEALPREVKLNQRAHALATEALDKATFKRRVEERGPATCDLILHDESVTGKKSYALREAFSLPALRDHIVKRCNWHEGVFNSIHWTALEKAMRKLTI